MPATIAQGIRAIQSLLSASRWSLLLCGLLCGLLSACGTPLLSTGLIDTGVGYQSISPAKTALAESILGEKLPKPWATKEPLG